MNRTAPTAGWTLSSPQETVALGRAIGESLLSGVVIGLIGELGAGKTHLVKGMAAGNAIDGCPVRVTSPTFALVHEYTGRITLYHLDAYRLRSYAELVGLGFDELCESGGAVVLEWADRVAEALPDDVLMLRFTVTGPATRLVNAEAKGPVARQCLVAVRARIGTA